jgi:hypothetical protein
MRTINPLLILISAIAVPAAADAASPLTVAACEYRDAARHFERSVRQVRFIDHYDERLVGRLENAACDLHSATHSHRLDRILYAWGEVQSLHARVDAAIFHRPCYPQHPVLLKCWERVTCAAANLAKEIECVTADPIGHGYRPTPSCGNGLHASFRFDAPHVTPQVRLPQAYAPRVNVPIPNVPLPPGFAPGSPRFGNPVNPPFAEPRSTHRLTEETRHFGPRNSVPTTFGRHHNVQLSGGDLRSAMIGAMLSRLLD